MIIFVKRVLVLCTFLVSILKGTDPQYFIVPFAGAEFPISINTCNPLSIISTGGYQKAVCIDETTVKYTTHSDSDCSDNTILSTNYYNESYQTGIGTYYDFNCDSASDASLYVSVELGISCSSSSKVTMNAATGVCTELSASGLSFQVQCEKDFSELIYYNYNGTYNGECDENLIYLTADATDECGYIITLSGINVYGSVVECEGIKPSLQPSMIPSNQPTIETSEPTAIPSMAPTMAPSTLDSAASMKKSIDVKNLAFISVIIISLFYL